VPELFGELVRKSIKNPLNVYGAVSSKYVIKLKETIAELEAQITLQPTEG